MKNGYHGLISWIFGIVAIAALAFGAYVLIGDFSFSSSSSNDEEGETTGEGDEGGDDDGGNNGDNGGTNEGGTDPDEAFYVEGMDDILARF